MDNKDEKPEAKAYPIDQHLLEAAKDYGLLPKSAGIGDVTPDIAQKASELFSAQSTLRVRDHHRLAEALEGELGDMLDKQDSRFNPTKEDKKYTGLDTKPKY